MTATNPGRRPRPRRPGRGTPFGLVTVLLADTDFIEVGRPE
jgi:hypothetical protein